MNPIGFLKNKAKDLAAAGFNAIPDDRTNMFLRYYTGLGGHNLDLDDSTLHAAREATVRPPDEAFKDQVHGPTGHVFTQLQSGPWRIEPKSGPVNPYASGDQVLSQTLGRYTSEVSPDKSTVRITDQYDMSNEFEDPHLTSGKFQPRKAWNELSTIWDPRANWSRNIERNAAGGIGMGGPWAPPESKGFSIQNVREGLKNTGASSTSSPLTTMARALMYLTPKKFTPYKVDVTVPSSGAINNQEVYN